MALTDEQKAAITLFVNSFGGLPGVNRAQMRAALSALAEDLAGSGGGGTVLSVNGKFPSPLTDETLPGNVVVNLSDIPADEPAP